MQSSGRRTFDTPRLRAVLLVASLCCAFGLAMPSIAAAGAVMSPAGYNTNTVARGDDNTVQVVNLPFAMNWFGTNYTQIYINQNGNCSFGQNFTGYNPSGTLVSQNRNIMAPFWGDVDTRVGGQTTYSQTTSPPTVDGRPAFFVNWIGVGYYNQRTDKLNSFQLVLVDRSDTGAGNFDFYFNYDDINWDIGSSASTYKARVGWARAAGNSDYFELPGSGVTAGSASTLLDSSSSATSLIQNSLDSGGVLGRYVWRVRNGAAPNIAPVITVTNRVLEGNVANGYSPYAGTGDAVATDADGTIASFTNNRPAAPLPLGTTTVLWTATDNDSAVTTATQTILVQDTTPPTVPGSLACASHTAGAWSTNPTMTVTWAASTDVCSGLDGYSYSWSDGAAATPDATADTTATTLTSAPGDGSWYFNVRSVDKAGNASTVSSVGPFRIDRSKPVTTDNTPTGWSTSNVTVTLTPADPTGVVASTYYRIDGAATLAYSVPFTITKQGTSTIEYWSLDAAGNLESIKTATVRVDTGLPTVPSGASASAVSTNAAAVSWGASSDAVSGVALYEVSMDGVLVGTTATTSFSATGLVGGQTYVFTIRALDTAGNRSGQSIAAPVTIPIADLWLDISTPAVDYGVVDPGIPVARTAATVITVGGVGTHAYDLFCRATDFSNADAGSPTPTMPVDILSYTTSGWTTKTNTAFANGDVLIDTSVGTSSLWSHAYTFDYTLAVPWSYSPGTYATTVTYTVIQK